MLREVLQRAAAAHPGGQAALNLPLLLLTLAPPACSPQHLDVTHARLPPGALAALLRSASRLTRLGLDVTAAAAAAGALAGMAVLRRLDLDLCLPAEAVPDGRAPREPGGLLPEAAALLRQVAAVASDGLPALAQLGVTFPPSGDGMLLAYCWQAVDQLLGRRPASRRVQLVRCPAVPALERLRAGALLAG